MIENTGSVLGIDVGYSVKRKSSAICRLTWTADSLEWNLNRFRATEDDRLRTISQVCNSGVIEVVALDGPFRGALDEINSYRVAEKILTRGFAASMGKPGQSSSPVGRKLNAATNLCIDVTLDILKNRLRPATHSNALHALSLTEAFPSAFLGVMLDDPADIVVKRGNRSDQFFLHASQAGLLEKLLDFLLPKRQLQVSPNAISNHDDRAAFVCAVTALCVTARKFVAVGDSNGWIILPPSDFIKPWAMEMLRKNAGSTSVHIET